MTEAARNVLTNWINQSGLDCLWHSDSLARITDKNDCHIGDLSIVIVDNVEYIKLSKLDRHERVPLCSPLVHDMIKAVLGNGPPLWDPIR